MLDTFIKNRGATKTIIHHNKHNVVDELKWDADYDGKHANIAVDLNKDGHHNHFDLTLNNNDLASILNIPSVEDSLEKRLKKDFIRAPFKCNPNIYKIELADLPKIIPIEHEPIYISEKQPIIDNESVKELLESIHDKKKTHISTPLPNEEFIIPLKINSKTIDNYTLTPRRHHRRLKTHKTYNVYKKPKSISRRKSSRSSRSRRRSSRTSNRIPKRLLL